MPDTIAEQIAKLTEKEREALREGFSGIPGSGKKAQPRVALTAALNEAAHRIYGNYRGAFGAYASFAALCGGAVADFAKSESSGNGQNETEENGETKDKNESKEARDSDKNFRNFLQRATRTGDTFDLWDASCFLVAIYDRQDMSAQHWRDTLTPYQVYLIGWVRSCIAMKRFSPPRGSDDRGVADTQIPNNPAAYRVENFVQNLRELQQHAHLEDLFRLPGGAVMDDAKFVYFRTGLDEPLNVVQGYLHIFSPRGSQTEFNTFSMNYECRGDGRFAGGVVIPAEHNIYLFGFQGWGNIAKGEIAQKIEMKNSLELIAIRRDTLGHGAIIPALTMSSDSTDKMLVGRIALRSTSLGDHKSSGADVYGFAELEKRLAALRVAEQRAVQASADSDAAAEAAAAVETLIREEARTIAEMINNVSDWEIADLLDKARQVKKSAFFRELVGDIFVDDNGVARFSDASGADYDEWLHWRAASLGMKDI